MVGKNTVSGEKLRGFVERIERLDEERASLQADKNEVMASAKAAGFVPAGIRNILRVRKMKPSDREEAENLLDMYMHALGMNSEGPLFRHVGLMSVDVTAKEQVIDAMKKFVPANGSITIAAGGASVRLTRDKDGNVTAADVVDKPEPDEDDRPRQPPKVKADVPDVDADGAEALGRKAFKDDVPIIRNPFPFGDARRARWDAGWRAESGSDGMDD